jgi:hypothetical protein
VTEVRVDVHDAIVEGHRIAARYTLTATMRTGRAVVSEIYLFGRVDPDGRLRQIHQISKVQG